MGQITIAYKILSGNLKERDNLKHLSIYGKITLEKLGMETWTDSSDSGQKPMAVINLWVP